MSLQEQLALLSTQLEALELGRKKFSASQSTLLTLTHTHTLTHSHTIRRCVVMCRYPADGGA